MRGAILDLLLGSRPKAVAAAAAVESSRSWPAVVNTCREWRVLLRLNRRLGELHIYLPPETRAKFRKAASEAFLRTSRRLERGAAALELLSRASIPCAGFKGVASAAILCPGRTDRTVQDVDVLIRQVDLAKALSELERNGYSPVISQPLEDYVAFVRNSPGFAGNEAIELTDAQGASIDLHWRLGRLDTEELLAGAEAVPLLGRRVPLLRAPYCITIAAHHALRNDFVPDEMIRDLLDFHDWLPWMETRGEVRNAIEIAKRNRVWEAALGLAHLSAEFGESRVPETFIAEAARADLRSAADLAELFRGQLDEGMLNSDLVYLFDARSIRQIVAGAASGWRRYRSYMKVFEQSNGRDPVNLRMRLKQLAAAIWRMPRKRWRLLRTLALVKSVGLR